MDIKLSLPDAFSFEDLFHLEGLHRLDKSFLDMLDAANAAPLRHARQDPEKLTKYEESTLILQLAPSVEDFLGDFFGIKTEVAHLQDKHHTLAPLYRCKRLFVQRQAVKAYAVEDTRLWEEETLLKDLEDFLQAPFSELLFATKVLKGIACEQKQELEAARRYSAWRCYHAPRGSVLFQLPQKKDPSALVAVTVRHHQGFAVWEKAAAVPPLPSREKALAQSHYCVLCHRQGKDSCSTGLKQPPQGGCPLEQKISEMNTLRNQGYALGALATLMIDNPLVAATGHRICNACAKACIYQKQEPVDVPLIETQTLQDVLALPWGFEIYSLLSRWNPLNFRTPLPRPPSGYKVLVAGLGPAGFTLTHHLLNAGHSIIGIDGFNITPLPPSWKTQPVKDVQSLFEPPHQRSPQGFGGVMEYGITSRWDKNALTLVRLLLERHPSCLLLGNVRLGSTLTVPQAFEKGFDHVALCLGAGRPNVPPLKNRLARGVRTASDFLMSLQLTKANLQLRLPIAVIGGGLTAVDTATEAFATYPRQVEQFLAHYEHMGSPALDTLWDGEEQEIATEFLMHARALRAEKAAAVQEQRVPNLIALLQKWGGATLFYRRTLQESPSYRLNDTEVSLALEQGIFWQENLTPEEVVTDAYGHACALRFQETAALFSCRSIFIATGTEPLAYERFLDRPVSIFGDLDQAYAGSVVKAMASAKKGAPLVTQALKKSPPAAGDFSTLVQHFQEDFRTIVQKVISLTPTIWEIVVKSPQAARQFRPGQFFRLQGKGIEPLALTGADVWPEQGLLSLIVLDVGASSHLCQFLKPGEEIALMGPTGTPTFIPSDEIVLLVGGGLGNAVLFSLARALKEKRNRVLTLAGYRTSQDIFKRDKLETSCDQMVWSCETEPVTPSRPQDLFFRGDVVQALQRYAQQAAPFIPLQEVSRLIVIGSDSLMAAIAQARHNVLKDVLNPAHVALGSINSPMQCMMKEICGQCLQVHHNPKTGETQLVYSCHTQDQLLDHVDFSCLHQRLKQNSVLEKLSRAFLAFLEEISLY